MQWKHHLSPKLKEHLPNSDKYANPEFLYRAFEFMYERNKIWKRRFIDKEPFPWTEDEILRDINFCNTYRIQDRNSQWEVFNITRKNHKLKKYVWRVIFFRYFNSPDFFEFLKDETDWENGIPKPSQFNSDNFQFLMESARENGINPFTNAYLTNSVICPGETRDYCFSQVVIPNLIDKLPEIVSRVKKGGNPHEFIKFLAKELHSCSLFIAHEFYVSLCFTNLIDKPLTNGWDHNTTNVGPGCSVGLRLIFNNLKNSKEEYEALEYLQKIGKPYIKKHFPDFVFTKWDSKIERFVPSDEYNFKLLEFEHLMCETSKLWRIRENIGGRRKKYIPKENKQKEYFFLY